MESDNQALKILLDTFWSWPYPAPVVRAISPKTAVSRKIIISHERSSSYADNYQSDAISVIAYLLSLYGEKIRQASASMSIAHFLSNGLSVALR
jgi:hypothetical protein